MAALGAIGVLTLTVALSLSRPRFGPIRIQPAGAAVLGATLTVGGGLLSPAEAVEVLHFLASPVLTIVSLMVITIIASRAGFFRVLAWKMAINARGDSRKLFRSLFFSGAVIGTVFTNDAAVLILTPMVFELVEEIRQPNWTSANAVPFYFTVLYVANLVGALVISNPINIIVADWFDIRFVEYALWMAIPAAVSMVVTYLGLAIFFRKMLPAEYSMPSPLPAPSEGKIFRAITATVLVITLVGFFSEPWLGIPTAHVAGAGALILLASYWLTGAGRLAPVAREVGWDAVIFVVGIFVVANGLRGVGLTDVIGSALLSANQVGDQFGNFVAGLVAALASAVMNNHPTAGIMALAIGDLPIDEMSRKMMALSALIGGDLGPKMLPIGSLAALLWFRILRQRGVEISYRLYIRLGVPVTLAAALLSMAALGLEYWLVS